MKPGGKTANPSLMKGSTADDLISVLRHLSRRELVSHPKGLVLIGFSDNAKLAGPGVDSIICS